MAVLYFKSRFVVICVFLLIHFTASARRLLGSSFAAPGNASFEYVVIGAGNAGIPIAVRLAEAGHTVALVEGGSFYEIGNSNYSEIPLLSPAFTGKDVNLASPQVDWGFQTTPQQGQNGETPLYPRGKTLGGCSARNYMAYHRGTKGAYQRWAQTVGDDSYFWENLLPYFEKSINFTPPAATRFLNATPKYDLSTLGNGAGPLSVTYGAYAWAFGTWGEKALAALGIPQRQGFTSGGLIGSSHQLLTVDPTEYTRDSAETSFLRKLGLSNPNLIVYPNTLATRIIFDSDKTAKGISIDFGGREYHLNASKEVIVSGGAFQSPQLLMVSGIGPASTLGHFNIPLVADRPGVGQNMWDHTLGGPSYQLNVLTSDEFANPEFVATSTQQFNNYPVQGPYASINGDLLAFEKLPNTTRSKFSNNTLQSLADLPDDWPEIEYLVISAYGGPSESYLGAGPNGSNYGTIQAALVAPFSRGNVSIQSSDMHDHPLINPNWLADPRDQEVALGAYKRVRDIFNTDVMKGVVIGTEKLPGLNVSSDADLLRQIRSDFGAVYHASCTCKMGKVDDPMAVVDSEANVIGVKGLRVVDASSFPFLPPGHPMATVYMLAEKIADTIIRA